ncbi:ABC transporter permease [Gorillibacterium massiliense]|uniref:ABC transporter permease n=1 Tax=Gorillibacterium massiliense TaxID=1280390 RepID=UPI0004AEDF9E|nr:ABC transporter permease [Gorillibacterium massiliense]
MAILTIARYEILQMVRSRNTFIVLLILPLLLILILGSALGNEFKPEDRIAKPVGIAVFSESPDLSAAFAAAFGSEEAQKYVQSENVSSAKELLDTVKKGKTDFGIHIGPQAAQTNYELISGKSDTKNMIAESVLRTIIDEVDSKIATATVMGGAVNAGLPQGTAELVTAERLNADDKEPTAMQYYSSAQLVMFLLFAGASAGGGLAWDRENRTLERKFAAPIRGTWVLYGKMLGRGAVSAVQALLIIVFTKFVYGVDWGHNLGYVALVCLLVIIASLSIALLLALLVKSGSSVDNIYSLIIFLMTFISGGMWPGIGGIIGKIAKGTISYWAANSFNRMMSGFDPSAFLPGIGTLAGLSLGLLLAALIVYRKVGYNE